MRSWYISGFLLIFGTGISWIGGSMGAALFTLALGDGMVIGMLPPWPEMDDVRSARVRMFSFQNSVEPVITTPVSKPCDEGKDSE